MNLLIIVVLGLLVLTRLYKLDQVKNMVALQLAWKCLLASVVVGAAEHLIMMVVRINRAECAELTNAVMLIALAASLYFWNKAVTAESSKDQNNA